MPETKLFFHVFLCFGTNLVLAEAHLFLSTVDWFCTVLVVPPLAVLSSSEVPVGVGTCGVNVFLLISTFCLYREYLFD